MSAGSARMCVLLIMLVGCSGSQRGSSSTTDLGCKVDPAAKSACDAQGSGYVYAAEPDFGCVGVDPGPQHQKEIDAAQRAHPCACMSQDEYDKRLDACASTP